MKKILLLIIVAAAVAGGVVLLTQRQTETITIDTNTTFKGDYTVVPSQKLLLKNNAVLVVDGDFFVKGTVECEQGTLSVVVKGDLNVGGKLVCNLNQPGTGIAMAISGSIIFGKDSAVVSNGSVQIVDDPAKIIKNQDELNKLYDAIAENTGERNRLGPFVIPDSRKEKSASAKFEPKKPHFGLALAVAQAQAPAAGPCIDNNGNVVPNCIQIGGQWILGGSQPPPPGISVPTPPLGVNKIVLNFNFGPDKQINLHNILISGPNGRNGADDKGQSCNAKGKDGENAFRLRIHAHNITINDFTLFLGNGGNGGDAETKKDCEHGIATGGNGGEAGNLKVEATGQLKIAGAFSIFPGNAGNGGSAKAYGKDGDNGCPAKKGGDATARGGRGADNKKDLSEFGSVEGLSNISVAMVIGGNGGVAFVNPGKGGNGTGCGCRGGDGGKGTATGGRGGDASLIVLGGKANSLGGNGGDVDSFGGRAGDGGQCDAKGPGGNGGKGGDSAVTKGAKGIGQTQAGADGKVLDQTGGNGGNGGDGCPEGKGGKEGSGNPAGKPGVPGKNLCVIAKPQPKTLPPSPTPQPQPQPETIPTEIEPLQLQGEQPVPKREPEPTPTSEPGGGGTVY